MESSALNRLSLIKRHVFTNNTRTNSHLSIKDDSGNYRTVDYLYRDGRTKLNWFKEKGWGYKDTEFAIDERTGQVGLTGDRYAFSGKILPDFRAWAEANVGIDIQNYSAPQKSMEVDPPILNEDFLDSLNDNFSRFSIDDKERIMHSHGH